MKKTLLLFSFFFSCHDQGSVLLITFCTWGQERCVTFAMSLMILLVLICSTKVSEKSDMAKS